MNIELVIDIAMDKIMADLCVKYYLETDDKIKQKIYNDEIIPLYKKINNIKK